MIPSLGILLSEGSSTTLNPTYNLNLTNGILDSSLTFSRASVGTYYNSAGVLTTASSGVARFDYNPVSLAARGLLIEESRTNLFTYSNTFSNVVWGKQNESLSGSTTSPDSTSDASGLIPTTTSSYHRLTIVSGFSISGGTASHSIYVKPNGYSKCAIREGNAGAYVAFDSSAGTVIFTSGAITGSIVSVGNGWYRITAVATGQTTQYFEFYNLPATYTTGSPLTAWSGDGTSGLWIFGAQLEVGAFSTSYIPTSGATVSRSADSVSNTSIGGWYNTSHGTFLAIFDSAALVSGSSIVGTATTGDGWLQQGSSGVIQINDGTAINTSNAITANTVAKAASTYSSLTGTICLNAGTVATGVLVGNFSTQTAIYLGSNAGTGAFLNGHLQAVKYYNTALTNTQLQTITT